MCGGQFALIAYVHFRKIVLLVSKLLPEPLLYLGLIFMHTELNSAGIY